MNTTNLDKPGGAAAIQPVVCQDQGLAWSAALDCFANHPSATFPKAATPPACSGPERVIADELENRASSNDALSMMVSSMVRMVQAGKTSDSRWKAS